MPLLGGEGGPELQLELRLCELGRIKAVCAFLGDGVGA